MTLGTRWWSVTMTSSPARVGDGDLGDARRPAVDGDDHASHRRPRRHRSPPATGRGPRRAGSGRTGSTATPNRRSASVMMASPVRPSASKSPKTSTRSPRSRAARKRSSTPVRVGQQPRIVEAARAAPRTTPPRRRPSSRRATRASAARRVVIPRSVAIAVTDAAGASRSGKVQRYRGSITASGCHARLHRGSSGAARGRPQEAERRTRGLRAAVSRPCRRSSQSCQSTSNGLATKIDE